MNVERTNVERTNVDRTNSGRNNAGKIETFIGILATSLIAFGLFIAAVHEPDRIVSAEEAQVLTDLDEAMTLYAQNCSVCHGLAGEGIGSTPALDSSALRESDPMSLDKIISRGLFGTSMPAWSKEDGGALSDYQIGELVALIQVGDWKKTEARVVNLGLAPLVPFTTAPDTAILEKVAGLSNGDLLVQGINLYAQQCVACHGADGMGTALAPALNDPAVRVKAPEELERTILNGVSGTLMAAWNNTLGGEDITALVSLITQWDQVEPGAIPAPEKPVPVTAESLALGSDLYSQNCARCHAPEGQGTRRAPALNVKGFLADTVDAALQQIITMGVPNTAMPSWGDRMSDSEIQAVVGFLRSWEPNAPEVAEAARGGGGPWWQSSNGTTNAASGKGPRWNRSTNTSPNAAPTAAQTVQPSGAQTAQPSGAQNTPAEGGVLETAIPTETAEANASQGAGVNQDGTPAAYQKKAAAGPSGVSGAQGTTNGTQQHTGSKPPWVQETQQAASKQVVDLRIAVLLVAVIAAALSLIGAAILGLARLKTTMQ